jgi:hypothetical protein
MGLPPSLAGGPKDTDTEVMPPTATPITGAPAVRAGTTAFEAAEGALVPMPFVALTVHM